MNIERITTLLASGLKPANVASIIGCTPSRISQLAQDPHFKDLLDSKIAESEKADIEEQALSSKYHAAEHILLNQIIDMAPVSELRDVTAALRVVAERQDKAKTRLNPVQASTIINQVISISVPTHTIPEINVTKEGEVISVNTMNLAPLTSEGVTNLFSKMKASIEGDSHDTARLPSPTEGFTSEDILSEEVPVTLETLEFSSSSSSSNPNSRDFEDILEALKA